MERPISRKQQKDQTRQLILDTAKALFKKHKYEDVSIKDICNASGVSVGTFYHHFESKDYLVELFYDEFDYYIEQFQETFDTLQPLEALFYLAEQETNYLSASVTYPSQICVMQLLSGGEAFKRESRIYYRVISDIISRIAKQNLGEEMTEVQLRSAILRSIRGNLYAWCLHNGGYDLKERALQDLCLLIVGLQAVGKLHLTPEDNKFVIEKFSGLQ